MPAPEIEVDGVTYHPTPVVARTLGYSPIWINTLARQRKVRSIKPDWRRYVNLDDVRQYRDRVDGNTRIRIGGDIYVRKIVAARELGYSLWALYTLRGVRTVRRGRYAYFHEADLKAAIKRQEDLCRNRSR